MSNKCTLCNNRLVCSDRDGELCHKCLVLPEIGKLDQENGLYEEREDEV